jgi:hypothetical protein
MTTGSCAECGFDWDATGPDDVVATVRRVAGRYGIPLTRLLPGEDPEVVLRTRPEPGVWSALEYAVHVAVVLGWYGERIERVLAEDRPRLDAYGFGEAADRDRYDERPIDATAAAVAEAGEALAARLEGLEPAAWERVGLGSDGDERTVLVLGRRAAHEGHHHLLDIGRVLRRVRGR